MWKYYSVALCSNTQGQQNFMHVGCTAADELPIESIWGRIRTNLLRHWWALCVATKLVDVGGEIGACPEERFGPRCGLHPGDNDSTKLGAGWWNVVAWLTYCIHKMWLRRLMTVACRIRESWWNLLYPQGDGWWQWKLNETQVDYPLFIYLAPLAFYGPTEVFMVAIIIYALLLSNFDCGGGY